LALKKAVQFAATVLAAPEPLPLPQTAADEDEPAAGDELDPPPKPADPLFVPLLPQAVTPTAIAHARMLVSDLGVLIANIL
jgi:hypothetical protein